MKKGWLSLDPIKKLSLTAFMVSIGIAAVTTIWAVYLESLLKDPSKAGFVISMFSVAAILSYFFLIPLIEKFNKVRLFVLAIFFMSLSYLFLFLSDKLVIVIASGFAISIFSSLRTTSFGIIIRDKSKRNKVSENEGFMYVVWNLSWFLGPIIGGLIADRFGFSKVFIFAALIIFLATILFISFKIKDSRKSKKIDKNILKVVREYFKSRNRTFAYVLGGGVNFWWGLVYVYMPIYIVENNLGDLLIGIFLAIVVIPLILLEYHFGKLAGRIGFRKIFVLGYSILAISAILCFFMENPYVILGILVLASVGAAMIEPTTEAYFFDVVQKDQRDKFYGPYNTAIDMGGFLATGAAAGILLFFPFRSIFILFGGAMIIFALLSSRIKNIIECKRKC